jgi:hypothetical protein
VVYSLDQVRALEQELRRRLASQGLPEIEPKVIVVTRLIPEAYGTTCNQRVENIHGTDSAYILRIPFRTEDGKVGVFLGLGWASAAPSCWIASLYYLSLFAPCHLGLTQALALCRPIL